MSSLQSSKISYLFIKYSAPGAVFMKSYLRCILNKCLEKVIFYFRWNWQVELLDFTLVGVVLGYFHNFNANDPFTYKRCMNCSSLPWQRKLFLLSFVLFVALCTPQESLKRYFSKCSIVAFEKRYLKKH